MNVNTLGWDAIKAYRYPLFNASKVEKHDDVFLRSQGAIRYFIAILAYFLIRQTDVKTPSRFVEELHRPIHFWFLNVAKVGIFLIPSKQRA